MSRLPRPGSDEGEWGDILNDFLLQAHQPNGLLQEEVVTADSIVDDTVTEIKLSPSVRAKLNSPESVTSVNSKTGVVQLTKADIGLSNVDNTADSSKQFDGSQITSGVIDASHLPAPSTDPRPAYPLSAYGFFAASTNLESRSETSALNNVAFFARVFVPAGNAINAVAAAINSAGGTPSSGLNSFAIYSDSGTLVATTANDNNQWANTGWLIKTLTTPIAAQPVDRFVYAAASARGYASDPYIVYNIMPSVLLNGGNVISHRRAFYAYNSGLSSWPASINPASYGNEPGGYLPFLALA